jgi:hypothetical protein
MKSAKQLKRLGTTFVQSLRTGGLNDMDKKTEYLINNPSCSAPFSVEVYRDIAEVKLEGSNYTIDVTILGRTFSRIVTFRLDAIIIAKDIARALEDAFRHTYEDRSNEDG